MSYLNKLFEGNASTTEYVVMMIAAILLVGLLLWCTSVLQKKFRRKADEIGLGRARDFTIIPIFAIAFIAAPLFCMSIGAVIAAANNVDISGAMGAAFTIYLIGFFGFVAATALGQTDH